MQQIEIKASGINMIWWMLLLVAININVATVYLARIASAMTCK